MLSNKEKNHIQIGSPVLELRWNRQTNTHVDVKLTIPLFLRQELKMIGVTQWILVSTRTSRALPSAPTRTERLIILLILPP